MYRATRTILLTVFVTILFTTIALCQPSEQIAPQSEDDKVIKEATEHFKDKRFDEAIQMLEEPAAANPNKLDVNILLAKALNEKCLRLKQIDDKSYIHLVQRPYRIGKQLAKLHPDRPEPYYVVAKSLLINERLIRAGKAIKKAISNSSPENKDYVQYQVTLADYYAALMEKGDPLAYEKAKKAYLLAIQLKKDDSETTDLIKQKLQKLEKKNK
ncbi:MAG: hypothetical protein GY874_20420 [Desulfobacteraceae bacterium]|nr:hypothetical protein [Desulfobacteraceae bacterium]